MKNNQVENITAKNKHIYIVRSIFNSKITLRLLDGAVNAFYHYDGQDSNLKIYHVPGALEIPGAIKQIINKHEPNAIIAIGAVIRGETFHFEIVSQESAHGISILNLSVDFPIINGILTTENISQAMDRSKIDYQNKGWESVVSALQTISVYDKINLSN